MNPKQLALLLVAGVALGGAGYLVRKKQDSSYQESNLTLGGKLMGDYDFSTVTGIRITSGTNQLNVVKTGDNWVIRERADFPANFGSLQDFGRKLADLKITKPVTVGPSRLPALELAGADKGSGTLVELLSGEGKTPRTLLLGKKVMREEQAGASPFGGGGGWPIARYVMVDGKVESVAVINEVLANAEPKPADWLDKEWIKIEQARFVSVTHPLATNSFVVARTNEFAEWSVVDARADEKPDNAKLTAFNTVLSSPSFNDVEQGDFTSIQFDTKVDLETVGGFKYQFQIGAESNGNMPMRYSVTASLPKERVAPADEKMEDKERLDKEFADKLKKDQEKLAAETARSKWVYLVSRWTIEPLLKNRGELMAEVKKDDAKPAEDAASATPGIEPLKLPGPN
jgi:hypothetical protein